MLLAAAFVVVIGGFLYRIAPQLAGFGGTLRRLRHGDPGWLVLSLFLEALSLGGYVVLFRGVFSCHGVHIGWRASSEITLAGTIATKLLAAGGAGGVALTAWALRASGLKPATVARRLVAFDVLLYAVYMAALIIGGLGLRSGILPGRDPWTVTLVPAGFALIVTALVLSMRLLPDECERCVASLAHGFRRGRRLLRRLAAVPRALHDGTGVAVDLIRRRQLALVGAPAYWAFDIAVLWVGFRAFGPPPSVTVVVMAYFVGTLANLLPVPGGVGGVEGGMIGTLLAFGVGGSAAVLAVLTYRAISFWLPMAPGAVAYWQLRNRVAAWRTRFGDSPAPRVPAAPASV
jgi:uncharacterized protein (TIRG00374 family)